jgi:hypothetical protein
MDDNNMAMLKESQSEWGLKLLRIILPHITDGIQAMFTEGKSICDATEEQEKYLMTFQNILSRVPKWNNEIVLKETKRIEEESGCTYLEDLITCVHIAHLKMLSSIRTGKSQKKIEINIPKLPNFIHSVYINISREMYSNVYLFDPTLPSLVVQKNKERIKEIIRQTILNTIRDNIPVEQLLKAYLDETTELMDEPKKKKEDKDKEKEKEKGIRFSETNMAMSVDNEESVYVTPQEEPAMKIMDVCLDPLPVEDLTPKQVPVEPELPIELPIEILEVKEEPVKKEPEIVLDIVELI